MTNATSHTPTSASSRTVNGPTPYWGACSRLDRFDRLGRLDFDVLVPLLVGHDDSLPAALTRRTSS